MYNIFLTPQKTPKYQPFTTTQNRIKFIFGTDKHLEIDLKRDYFHTK